MKTIGLIGGMSWKSTVPYYREINELVRLRLGGLHSARVALYSVDFADIEPLQRKDRWDEAGEALARAGRAVEAEGREIVHRVLYEELCRGVVTEESRARYREVIDGLVRKGAAGVILGCTEIAVLVSPSDSPVPVFDTTRLRAAAAVDLALAER